MIRRYVEQILNLYNFIDGLLVCNKDGFIEYFMTFRPDVNSLTEEEVLDRHILNIHPNIAPENSSILTVLRTGDPIFNQYQHIINYKGEHIYSVNTTLPIRLDDSTIIGVVEVSRYLDNDIGNELISKDITLTLKKTESTVKNNQMLYSLEDIYTNSQSMYKIKEKIERIANTNSAVMIYGETGTGKELIAQAIHSHGTRSKGPFVSQNCAAIPATLLEGILFGTEKGSYTGAINRKGLFELANGGTLFLDEINSMELAMQAKILRAIEEKKVRRVGSNQTVDLDIRIISAANEDPYEAIKSGSIRQDLYFRLATVLIKIPPLRERKGDIKYLTKCFINDINEVMGMQVIGVTEEVEKIFELYPWPGNVRELKNIIEGTFNFLSGRFIKKTDLPEYILNPYIYLSENNLSEDHVMLSLEERVERYEKSIISNTLKVAKSMSETANMLKLSKQALNYKLNKYNLKS